MPRQFVRQSRDLAGSSQCWGLVCGLLIAGDERRPLRCPDLSKDLKDLLGNLVIEILQAAGLPPDLAGRVAFAAFHYMLGHTIEEQAQIELNERGVWEPKLTVDGMENKLAATAFAAGPAERFGCASNSSSAVSASRADIYR